MSALPWALDGKCFSLPYIAASSDVWFVPEPGYVHMLGT